MNKFEYKFEFEFYIDYDTFCKYEDVINASILYPVVMLPGDQLKYSYRSQTNTLDVGQGTEFLIGQLCGYVLKTKGSESDYIKKILANPEIKISDRFYCGLLSSLREVE